MLRFRLVLYVKSGNPGNSQFPQFFRQFRKLGFQKAGIASSYGRVLPAEQFYLLPVLFGHDLRRMTGSPQERPPS